MQRAAYSVIKTSLAPPSPQLSFHGAMTDINGFTSGYKTPTVTARAGNDTKNSKVAPVLHGPDCGPFYSPLND